MSVGEAGASSGEREEVVSVEELQRRSEGQASSARSTAAESGADSRTVGKGMGEGVESITCVSELDRLLGLSG